MPYGFKHIWNSNIDLSPFNDLCLSCWYMVLVYVEFFHWRMTSGEVIWRLINFVHETLTHMVRVSNNYPHQDTDLPWSIHRFQLMCLRTVLNWLFVYVKLMSLEKHGRGHWFVMGCFNKDCVYSSRKMLPHTH